MVRSRRLSAIVIGCCIAAVCAVAPARATPTWSPLLRLSPNDGGPVVAAPRVAVDNAGDVTVAWERASVIQAISRAAGSAAWSSIADLGFGRGGSIAVGARGDAVVTFTKGGYPSYVQAVYRSGPAGAWTEPVTLSSDGTASGGRVAVNERGDAVVVWSRSGPNGLVDQASARTVASGVWEAERDISDPGWNTAARGGPIAIDDVGNAVAGVVRAGRSATSPFVQITDRNAATGVWARTGDLAGPYLDVWSVQAAFDGAGNVVAAWIVTRREGARIVEQIETSSRSAGGSWSRPVTISQQADSVGQLRLGVARDGTAIVVWSQASIGDRGGAFASVRRPPSAVWSPPVELSPQERGVSVWEVDLAVDRRGNAVAVWTDYSGRTQSALRPAAARAWLPAVDVPHTAGGSFALDVAIDEHAHAIATWAAGAPSFVEGSELRPDGPILSELTTPARLDAGRSARFSVRPLEWGSPLTDSPRWTFGDGGVATGAVVSHIYARPGSYTVSVTQSDAAGGTSTAVTALAVTAPAIANTGRPVISGNPRVGSTLRCRPGAWRGVQPMRYGFSWLRGSRVVATSARYRLAARDAGALVACLVRASNAAGTATATSKPVRVRR